MSQYNHRRVRQVSLRRLPSIRTGISLIWLENSSLFSKESDDVVNYLRGLHTGHIFRCNNISSCFKYLKRAKSYERIIVIMNVCNDSSITTDSSRLSQYRQIQSIFVNVLIADKDNFVDVDLSGNTREEIDKIGGIFHSYRDLLDRLQKMIKDVNEFDNDLFTFFNRPEKALRDLRHELGPYIWSQSYKVIVSAMPHDSPEARRDILTECRACCRDIPEDLRQIDEFARTYRSTDAILWYTKPCFLHCLINRALRTEDILVLYKLRYFIVDLCARLEEAALANIDHTKPFRVYRGSKLSRDEVEKLQAGSLVATNGFFSSSKHVDVARCFIGIDPVTGISPSRSRDDQWQYVLFGIDVDLTESPELAVADISGLSAIPDEHEVLFSLDTTFIITNIDYDRKHRVWHISLTSSSEVAQIRQEYSTHIQKRFTETKPVIMFGHILSEMSSDYYGALTYFHRLLRSKPWNDEDRSDVYHYLGRVYRALGKNQQAKTYFRCAILLQRRRLPESSMVYGRVLSCLGTIYCEEGDLSRATRLYEQAMALYRKSLPKTHYEFGFHSNRLAQVYWQNGQYESARELLMSTISFVQGSMPENSPGQAQTLHLMGLVQHSLNDRQQAINYFEQSLKMRESSQASDHPYAARTCYELSLLYAEQDDYTTALRYARSALNIREIKLSSNHKELKQSLELVHRLSQQSNAIPSQTNQC